ncbi:MAG TPA: sulfatase [Pirellulales bacterium]|nr:sulfatase [Pirellulales bacterium]
MKTPLLISLLLTLPSLATAFAEPAKSDAPRKMNVLFLIADDLNCDLHCYGHPHVKSPNIDRLAARGVRFEHAYCQFPLCSPSRSSFLTGRRPNATHIHTNPRAAQFSTDYRPTPHFREFIPDTLTMPQLFRRHGYTAARVGKLFHYGVPGQIGTSGLDDPESWDFVVNPAGRDKAEENKIFTLTPHSYGGTLSWLAAEGADPEQTDGLGATAAVSLLEEYKDRPFFLAVGFYRPHTPYVAPKRYFDEYDVNEIGLPALSHADRERMPAAAYASAKQEQAAMSDDLRREAIRAYWASITFMDAQLGRVLDALDRLELTDNTIVVMTSDHGYHMYQHGLWQKMSLFENSAHVPLIVSLPGAAGRGKSNAGPVELVDIYPTLADLCGLPAPDYLDGTSLRPALNGPSKSVKEAAFTQVRRGDFDGYSIRTSRWRYTLWDEGRKGEQLYDMQSDPGEMTNLAAHPAQTQTVATLKAQLQNYAKRGGK